MLAQGNIMTKHFKLQPEYMGMRKIKVTVSNVPISLLGYVLTFLSKYSRVEDFDEVQSTVGSVVRDSAFLMCLESGALTRSPI